MAIILYHLHLGLRTLLPPSVGPAGLLGRLRGAHATPARVVNTVEPAATPPSVGPAGLIGRLRGAHATPAGLVGTVERAWSGLSGGSAPRRWGGAGRLDQPFRHPRLGLRA